MLPQNTKKYYVDIPNFGPTINSTLTYYFVKGLLLTELRNPFSQNGCFIKDWIDSANNIYEIESNLYN